MKHALLRCNSTECSDLAYPSKQTRNHGQMMQWGDLTIVPQDTQTSSKLTQPLQPVVDAPHTGCRVLPCNQQILGTRLRFSKATNIKSDNQQGTTLPSNQAAC